MAEMQIDNSWTSTFHDKNSYFQLEYDRNFKRIRTYDFSTLMQKLRNKDSKYSKYQNLKGNYNRSNINNENKELIMKNVDKELLRKESSHDTKIQNINSVYKYGDFDYDSRMENLSQDQDVEKLEINVSNNNLSKSSNQKEALIKNQSIDEDEDQNSESLIHPIHCTSLETQFVDNDNSMVPNDFNTTNNKYSVELKSKKILIPKTKEHSFDLNKKFKCFDNDKTNINKRKYDFKLPLNKERSSMSDANKINNKNNNLKFPVNLTKENQFLENNYYSMTLDELNDKNRRVVNNSKSKNDLISKIAKQELNLNAEISNIKYMQEANSENGVISDMSDYVTSGLSKNIFNDENIESFLSSNKLINNNAIENLEKTSVAFDKENKFNDELKLKKENIDQETLTDEIDFDNNILDMPLANWHKYTKSRLGCSNPVDLCMYNKGKIPSFQPKKFHSDYISPKYTEYSHSPINENKNYLLRLDNSLHNPNNSINIENSSTCLSKFDKSRPISTNNEEISVIQSRRKSNKLVNQPFCEKCFKYHFMCHTINMNRDESINNVDEQLSQKLVNGPRNCTDIRVPDTNFWRNSQSISKQDQDTLELLKYHNPILFNSRCIKPYRVPNLVSLNRLDLRVFCRGKLIYDPYVQKHQINH